MSKQSQTLRDLIANCIITGATSDLISIETATATDLIRAVTAENPVNTPWTAVTYTVSGYTVPWSQYGAVYTSFFVNTGATMTTLSTGNTVIQSWTMGTAVPTGTTVTESITYGVSTESEYALRVSIGGTGTATFGGDVVIVGNLTVSGSTYEADEQIVTYQYFGPKTSDGSWRMYISGTDLVTERREGGNWVLKHTITA
jgi:hypothetical protein